VRYVISGAEGRRVGVLAEKGFWLRRGSRRLSWKEKRGFTQIVADQGADLPWKGLADFELR
jgi:hypothetical protein